MSFKKIGSIRKGLAVGGFSIAKYRDDSGAIQVRAMRNGRSRVNNLAPR